MRRSLARSLLASLDSGEAVGPLLGWETERFSKDFTCRPRHSPILRWPNLVNPTTTIRQDRRSFHGRNELRLAPLDLFDPSPELLAQFIPLGGRSVGGQFEEDRFQELDQRDVDLRAEGVDVARPVLAEDEFEEVRVVAIRSMRHRGREHLVRISPGHGSYAAALRGIRS